MISTPIVFEKDFEKFMLYNVVRLVFSYYNVKAYTISFEGLVNKLDSESEEQAESLFVACISGSDKKSATYIKVDDNTMEKISDTQDFEGDFTKLLPDFELTDSEKENIEDLMKNSFSGLKVEDFSYGF